MEKQRIGLLFFLAIVISLALASFLSSVIAETKKAKKKDVKLVNAMCYMPESNAFGFGMAAIACLVVAHTLTNFFFFSSSSFSCSSPNKPPAVPTDHPLPPSNSTVSASSSSLSSSAKYSRSKPTIPAILLMLLSWASFGMAAMLLGGATSMSGTQPYGNGWLDGRCYVVKDGIYAGSGVLTLFSTAAALASALVTVRKAQSEPSPRVHAQAAAAAAAAS